MSFAPGTKLGPYLIVDALGAGGMGEVNRACDTRLEREVAVKVLPEAVPRHADALARFQREARAVAALSHPNILTLSDVGEDRGIAYAVTSSSSARPFGRGIERGPLPLNQAVELLAASIAEGLAAAQDKDFVHRDLKPENLYVTAGARLRSTNVIDLGYDAREIYDARVARSVKRPSASSVLNAKILTDKASQGAGSPRSLLPSSSRASCFGQR